MSFIQTPKGKPNVCKAYWASCLFSWSVWGRALAGVYCYQKTKSTVISVQSALSDLKRPPERLQSQCNYRPFIT